MTEVEEGTQHVVGDHRHHDGGGIGHIGAHEGGPVGPFEFAKYEQTMAGMSDDNGQSVADRPTHGGPLRSVHSVQ